MNIIVAYFNPQNDFKNNLFKNYLLNLQKRDDKLNNILIYIL